ncbi:hypothetical protein GCM10009789_86740 [Kribbella sancticallisti]|uniref:DUF3592 domain-containing protein n=1 Tax=Kribbella sancticallisti TaxID=460087 RepID=A0ABP4QTI2_9ACTN
MRKRRRGRWRRTTGESLRWALVCISLLPLCLWITSADQAEDRLLADAPVVTGIVVDEPVPLIERSQPLTIAFTTSRGERVEMTIEKYLVPSRTKGQSIEIQYAYDGDEVLAREAGWEPDFWSRYLFLFMGIAGAVAGVTILIVSWHRHPQKLREQPRPD